jgi:hypothetical protein
MGVTILYGESDGAIFVVFSTKMVVVYELSDASAHTILQQYMNC